ncbi:MAG TPA: phosphoribosyltransferase, partial [Candidatus Hodarchaeales archaeon]|nr:phosphoribosyltransferase [Candidatus Hodarchaeales archaeon]
MVEPVLSEFQSEKWKAYRVTAGDLPKKTFILASEFAENILFCPWVTGYDLQALAKRCSSQFLDFLPEISDILNKIAVKSVCQLVPLSGSLFYNLNSCYSDKYGRSLPLCFMGAKRELRNNQWVTRISYVNLEALPNPAYLLIGDTIATGGTLKAMIKELKKERPTIEIEGIAVFTIAGTTQGARVTKMLSEIYPEAEISYVAMTALFGLQPNGTDMPF